MAQQTDIEFSFDEAVRAMGLTPAKLQRLIDEGVISAKSSSPDTRISRQALLAYMAQVTSVGKPRGKKAAEGE